MNDSLNGRPEVWTAHYPTNMRRVHGWLAAVLILLASASATAAQPQRIVSTFLCTDEYVFRLVPRTQIAALSFEAGDRNPIVSTIADQVGGIPQIHPTTETVLNFHPDLVVMYRGTNPHLQAHLEQIGVPILDVPWANSIADIRRITRMLGDKLGARDRAEALLAEMDRTLAAARARRVSPPVRTLIYEANGYAAEGRLPEELMTSVGLEDAAPGMGLDRMGRIPVETVVAAAPELVILSGRQTVRNARADLVLHHPALEGLQGRSTVVWRSLRPLLCPGPWTAQAALTFAELGDQARMLARRQTRN